MVYCKVRQQRAVLENHLQASRRAHDRAHRQRLKLATETLAATKIQRSFRGRMGRRVARQHKFNQLSKQHMSDRVRRLKRETRAAVRIQSTFRGARDRFLVRKKNDMRRRAAHAKAKEHKLLEQRRYVELELFYWHSLGLHLLKTFVCIACVPLFHILLAQEERVAATASSDKNPGDVQV